MIEHSGKTVIAEYLHVQCNLLDEPIDSRHSP